MKPWFFCSAGLLLLALSALPAGETVYLDEADPPFMYALNGEASGVYTAIIREAFRRMDVPVSILAVPWKRAMAESASGAAGVAGVYKNAERLRKYDFSASYYTERISIFVPAGNPLGIRTLPDLAGKRVIDRFGWTYGDEFDRMVREKRFEVFDMQSDEQAVRMLLSGRGDALLLNAEKIHGRLTSLGLLGALEALPLTLPIGEVHLAFAKTASKKELLLRFNAAVESMVADGVLDRLAKAAIAEWEAAGSPD